MKVVIFQYIPSKIHIWGASQVWAPNKGYLRSPLGTDRPNSLDPRNYVTQDLRFSWQMMTLLLRLSSFLPPILLPRNISRWNILGVYDLRSSITQLLVGMTQSTLFFKGIPFDPVTQALVQNLCNSAGWVLEAHQFGFQFCSVVTI